MPLPRSPRLYHMDVYLPSWLNDALPRGQYLLYYGEHALERACEKGIPPDELPPYLDASLAEPIEIEVELDTEGESSHPTRPRHRLIKVLYRLSLYRARLGYTSVDASQATRPTRPTRQTARWIGLTSGVSADITRLDTAKTADTAKAAKTADTTDDICLVVIPGHHWRVKTVWKNDRDDNHTTLKRKRYEHDKRNTYAYPQSAKSKS